MNATEIMEKNSKNSVALITGSSSGIGLATAIMLARNGINTYASMRNLKKSKTITELASNEGLSLQVIQLDVNDDRSVKNAVYKIVTESERIDILINNAGFGLFGSVEDISMEEMKAQFETNFFGVIRLMQLVIPIMRRQKSGRIVNITSVGGRVSLPILSAYNSTKFALEGLSESISYELEPFGIRVIIIEPGVIKTNIMNSSIFAKKAQDPKSPYFPVVQKIENNFKSMMENNSSPPEEVAKLILEAVMSKNPELRYTVGNDAATLVQARISMSDIDFKKMIMQNFVV
jgi:NAD(P)-dependent dehydrogenase (short-subunit alcohol dehydrogenase family)